MTATARQLAANRKNAGKSRGPRTAGGKGISKMNAVKHGILSTEVVVRGLHIQEREEEFQALRARFWEELAPVGPVEEMLVERIVTVQWRLRRVLKAETGEIALSVDGERWKRSNREPISMEALFSGLSDASAEMKKSAVGLIYLTRVLEGVRNDVTREGELSEDALQRVFVRFGNEANALTRDLRGLRDKLKANPGGLPDEALKEEHRREVLEYVAGKLQSYKELSGLREVREAKEEAAQQAADMIPAPVVLDKILRYETTLERQLYRALNQLERLQRRRNGENVPPPLSVEVSRRS